MKWIFAVTLLGSAHVFAAQFEYPVKAQDEIIIKGYLGKVSLQTQAQLKTIKIKTSELGSEGSDWAMQVSRLENQIVMQVPGPQSKKDWQTAIGQKRWPTHNIEILSPPMPLKISWKEGSINLSKWQGGAQIHLGRGSVSIQGGKGHLMISQQKGDLQIADYSGPITVDAYSVKANLKNLDGDLQLVNFSGESLIDKIKGSLSIEASQGASRVQQGSGSLQFQNGRGNFTVQQFAGRVEGENKEGSINISSSAEAEVSIRSEAGRVQIFAAKQSGANINLSNQDGELYAPSYLSLGREASQRTAKGRLRGTVQKGFISVRAKSGSIILKQ